MQTSNSFSKDEILTNRQFNKEISWSCSKIKLMTIVQKDFKNNVLSIFQVGQLADPEQLPSLEATSLWLVGASRSPPWSTW